jgi:hypothetical protein
MSTVAVIALRVLCVHPCILISKVEGVPLNSVWNNMDDDKCRIILQQVIDILAASFQ